MRPIWDGARVPEVGALLAAAVVIVAAACAGSDETTERSTTSQRAAPGGVAASGPYPGPYPGAGQDCPTAEPTPITISQATAALRRQGFTVSAVPRSCGLRTISAMLTNATTGLDVRVPEGTVDCFVLVKPPGAPRDVVGGDTAAASAERRLANLHCNLYGPQQRGFEAIVARLDRAFGELRRATKP